MNIEQHHGGSFLLLQEFGRSGYALIPGALGLSERLCVWAPSAAAIDSEYESGRIPFDSTEFIEAVDHGIVQVGARQEWIFSRASREKGYWRNSPWTSGFDDVLCKWAVDDEAKPAWARRVIGLPTGAGYDFARGILREPDHQLAKKVREQIASGNIETGAVEAARLNYRSYDPGIELTESDYLVYHMLAWAKNYVEAQVETDPAPWDVPADR